MERTNLDLFNGVECGGSFQPSPLTPCPGPFTSSCPGMKGVPVVRRGTPHRRWAVKTRPWSGRVGGPWTV